MSTTGTPVRLLLVEDSEDDAELILRALRRGGIDGEHLRVDTAQAMNRALDEETWDAIIADYSMPQFSGLDALALVKQRGLDVPFILASGVIGEDVAVEAMRAGAHDYVMKSRLTRLPLVIARELRDSGTRRDKRRAEEALRRAESARRFLAAAGEALAVSLESEATIERIAGLCVPALGESCSVDVPMDEQVASVSARWQSGRVRIETRWRDAQKFQSTGPARVMRTGESEKDNAWLCVPMRANGRVLGALTLGREGRRFDAFDLELVEGLANRAAVAVDHARLYREAKEAVRARDDFLSIASHELRTPLTPLRLHLQRLLDAARRGAWRDLDPADLVSSLDSAARQVDRLGRLVANLLDVSRIVAGRVTIERETVDLTALVQGVAERSQPELERAGCRLLLRAPGPLWGKWDRLRIEQVVVNLLSNAMKYGAGKPIEITVRPARDAAELVVRDHGIGVPPEEVERIFGRFERAVSARAYGGMGLGLYIVRQFVEAHGGRVRIESKPGKGAEFTVVLPVDRSASTAHISQRA